MIQNKDSLVATTTQSAKPKTSDLPPIPNKRYFTIGEVSDLCQLKTHVLRYWEQEFSQLRPAKRRGNRRYYQHKDVLLIRQIQNLLHNEGYTINGARLKLSGDEAGKGVSEEYRFVLKETIQALEDIYALYDGEESVVARQIADNTVSCSTKTDSEVISDQTLGA